MKAGSRPQYYRIRRMVQMVREGAETGYLANSSDFMKEFEVSRRTVARDLDFLRDEERFWPGLSIYSSRSTTMSRKVEDTTSQTACFPYQIRCSLSLHSRFANWSIMLGFRPKP